MFKCIHTKIMERLFKDVRATNDEVVETKVEGIVPEWLTGELIRVGPGKWDLTEDFTVKHWFDGCAILLKFHLSKGRVTYQSRYAQTTAYENMLRVGRPVVTEFGTASYEDPKKGLLSRFFNKLLPSDLTDNVCGNVFAIGQPARVFAVTETCYAWHVNTDSLLTDQKVDMHKWCRANLFSPHPLTDADGCLWNIGSSFFTGLKYHLIKIDPRASGEGVCPIEKSEVIATWNARHRSALNYFHSFAMTDNYIIFIEQPLLINLATLMTTQIKKRPMRDAFEWHPNEKTRFVVIHKRTGHISDVLYETAPIFILHTINAFERCADEMINEHTKGDWEVVSVERKPCILLDAVCYRSDKVFDKFYIANLRTGDWGADEEPSPLRFTLPLETHELGYSCSNQFEGVCRPLDTSGWEIHPQSLCPKGMELVTINGTKLGKPYRFFYASGVFDKANYENSILKIDLYKREVVARWDGEVGNHYPGEPLFVPCPQSTDEDDGVLLSVVSDISKTHHSFLLLLEARTLTEIARARVPSHVQVPLTFHGVFLPTFN